jgi:cytochrome c-type biogenesis protein CcmH/NrfF
MGDWLDRIWTPITICFNNMDFSATLNYTPLYLENVFNLLFWFVPMLFILYFSICIILMLNKHSCKKSQLSNVIRVEVLNNAILIYNQHLVAERTEVVVDNENRPMKRRNSLFVHPFLSRMRMQPQVRYLLIILIYWTQWFIPCVAVLVNGLCNCIPNSVFITIYWLT